MRVAQWICLSSLVRSSTCSDSGNEQTCVDGPSSSIQNDNVMLQTRLNQGVVSQAEPAQPAEDDKTVQLLDENQAPQSGGFYVSSLSSSCNRLDMNSWSGDDGGMVWYSSTADMAYYEGDSRIVAWNPGQSWSGGPDWSTTSHRESVHADPVSGQIYQLLTSSNSPLSSSGTFARLRCLNQHMGTISTNSLSSSFSLSGYTVMIGDGQLAVQDGSLQWRLVELGCSGTRTVTPLTTHSNTRHLSARGCERGRQGGILELHNGQYRVIYPQSGTIYRMDLTTGSRSTVVSAPGDTCSLALDVERSRWYYHAEGQQGMAEPLFSCSASITQVTTTTTTTDIEAIASSEFGGSPPSLKADLDHLAERDEQLARKIQTLNSSLAQALAGQLSGLEDALTNMGYSPNNVSAA